MNRRRLLIPWSRSNGLFCTPGSLTVKMRLGESPRGLPLYSHVRRGLSEAASKIDGGPIDRIARHFSDVVRVSHVHTPACAVHDGNHFGRQFDDIEHAIGLSRTFQLEVDEDCPIDHLVDALRQVPAVEEAGPHYISSIPFAAPVAGHPGISLENAWATRDQIRAADALAYEAGDAAVIVSVVDTGVMADHPELSMRVRRGRDMVHLSGRDLASGIRLLEDSHDRPFDPADKVGHGTSCAAIIGGIGRRIPPGLAGECGILPIRVLGAAIFPGRTLPIGVGSVIDIDRGLKGAFDLGCKVANMSFGTPEQELEPGDPVPHLDVIRYGLARGCILVAASGNSGREERFSPASIEGVIAVGAVGLDDRPSSFSTSGEHVALSAPGENVVSAGLGGYSLNTGTSFASPFVAAAAALLVSRANARAFALDGPTARRLLVASARPWGRGLGRGAGSGVLDAHAALRALDQLIDHAQDTDTSLGAFAVPVSYGGPQRRASFA